MSQPVEISLDTLCYLCDSFLAQSQEPYVVYKCFCCMKFTPYCFSCELKIQKLFGRGNFFKCVHCNKLTNAIDKIEINPSKHPINSNQIQKGISINNSFYKTPTKPFVENNAPISSIKCVSSNYLVSQKNEEERKDNNISTSNKMLSNFINEFNMINLALNSNKNNVPQVNQNQNCQDSHNNLNNNSVYLSQNNNNNIQNNSNLMNRTLTTSGSVNNFKKISNFSLLRSKRRLNKKFCLNDTFLGKKRDESNMKSEFRGYNKSKEKTISINKNKDIFGTTKPKKLISRNMSKVYKTENNINNNLTCSNIELGRVINNFKRENCELNNIFLNNNGSSGFPLFNDNNMRSNLFVNNQNGGMGQNSTCTDGTTTPHRIYDNNDGQYF